MSAENCTCFSGKSPLGLPKCVATFGKDKVLIIVDEIAADGTYNEVKQSDLIDGKLPKAFIDAKLNHDDPTKRWYMTAPFNLVDPIRAETIRQEIGGISFPVRPGNKIWTGTIVAPPAYLKALNTHICGQGKTAFTVDALGNLKGKQVLDDDEASVLRGWKIENNTMDSIYNEGAKDEKQTIMYSFMVAETERDSDFGFLSVSSMSFNFHSLPGIFKTVITITDISVDDVTFTLTDEFGSFGESNPVTGIEDTDIDLYNVTDEATVAITTLVEDSDNPGTYVATYSVAQDEEDEIRVSLDKDYYYAESASDVIPT